MGCVAGLGKGIRSPSSAFDVAGSVGSRELSLRSRLEVVGGFQGDTRRYFRVDGLGSGLLYGDGLGMRLGVGVSSPSFSLDVSGGTWVGGSFRYTSADVPLHFSVDAAGVGVGGVGVSGGLSVYGSSVFNGSGLGYSLRVLGKTEDVLYVSGGRYRVGIGTGSPSGLLSVEGSSLVDVSESGWLSVSGGLLYVSGGLGRVGVGTKSPQELLDVGGASVFNAGGLWGNDVRVMGGSGGRFVMSVDVDDHRVVVGSLSSPSSAFAMEVQGDLDVSGGSVYDVSGGSFRVFGVSVPAALYVSGSAERVGIGAENPDAVLDVGGSLIVGRGGLYNASGGAYPFRVRGVGSDALYVSGDARMGIGTVSLSSSTLTVSGGSLFHFGEDAFRIRTVSQDSMVWIRGAGVRFGGLGSGSPSSSSSLAVLGSLSVRGVCA